MFYGMQEIVASVSDVARVARVFTAIGGWKAKRLPDAPREQWKAWHVPRSVKRIEQVLLTAAGDDRGCVRLVRFHGGRQRVMRSSGRTWDTGGIFDIDVFARDARAVYRRLQAEGWSAYGDPVDYSWAGFDVCEVVTTGPDGLVIALIEPHHPPLAKFPRYQGFSRVFNSAQMVRDPAATRKFFVDVLGWKYLIDSEVRDAVEPGQLMLGLPLPIARTVVRKIGVAHPRGENDGSLEPISMPELGGVDFSEHCVAPNLGWLCWRFAVDDARAYARTIASRGHALYSPPQSLAIAGVGDTTMFSVRTPDGAILEFYESKPVEPRKAPARRVQSVARRPRRSTRRSGPR